MIGYDLKSGSETWSYNGLPAGCVVSPVIADGEVFFAWGGGGDEAQSHMPAFDAMLKNLDKNNDGVISREEGENAAEDSGSRCSAASHRAGRCADS